MSWYSEKLKDPRWQRRRLEVLDDREFQCEECGNRDKTLHVHHKIYRKGFDPWDYVDDDLDVLCEDCHQSDHNLRNKIADLMAKCSQAELQCIVGYAAGLLMGKEFIELEVSTYEGAQGIGAHYLLTAEQILALLDESGTLSDVAVSEFKAKTQ